MRPKIPRNSKELDIIDITMATRSVSLTLSSLRLCDTFETNFRSQPDGIFWTISRKSTVKGYKITLIAKSDFAKGFYSTAHESLWRKSILLHLKVSEFEFSAAFTEPAQQFKIYYGTFWFRFSIDERIIELHLTYGNKFVSITQWMDLLLRQTEIFSSHRSWNSLNIIHNTNQLSLEIPKQRRSKKKIDLESFHMFCKLRNLKKVHQISLVMCNRNAQLWNVQL